jgi:NADPH:quinone reductase-like Zn-dependent oxidoreductase
MAPEGIDLVLDCMAGDDCERGLALLKFNGKYVMYGTSSLLSWDVKNLFGITKGMSNVSARQRLLAIGKTSRL